MSKVIILRGNSGSGKSSVAREVQERVFPHPILIEHDHFRRKIAKEKESPEIINDKLMLGVIEAALKDDRDIIIEGILPFNRPHTKYAQLVDKIFQIHPTENYIYYFDIPFAETLIRHQTKPNAHEFGEQEMRRWYDADGHSGYQNEVIIGPDSQLDDTVEQIITQTGLQKKLS